MRPVGPVTRGARSAASSGVSKQAARKRFAEAEMVIADLPDLPLRPRLVACLDAARREAVADGSTQPGSQHLLLGLFAEGYAANLLDGLGVTLERARAEVRLLFPGPMEPDPDAPLAAATRFARECGHDDVGTEHLLFVLANDLGCRANRVLEHLGVGAAVRRSCDASSWPADPAGSGGDPAPGNAVAHSVAAAKTRSGSSRALLCGSAAAV